MRRKKIFRWETVRGKRGSVKVLLLANILALNMAKDYTDLVMVVL